MPNFSLLPLNKDCVRDRHSRALPAVSLFLSFPVCFQGPSQWVTLEFPQLIRVSQLQIQFQGGFSSRRGCLEGTRRPWVAGVPGVTPDTHCLSLLKVHRAVRLSARLQISTLRTTTRFRYPAPASGVEWSVPLDSPKPEWEA